MALLSLLVTEVVSPLLAHLDSQGPSAAARANEESKSDSGVWKRQKQKVSTMYRFLTFLGCML